MSNSIHLESLKRYIKGLDKMEGHYLYRLVFMKVCKRYTQGQSSLCGLEQCRWQGTIVKYQLFIHLQYYHNRVHTRETMEIIFPGEDLSIVQARNLHNE